MGFQVFGQNALLCSDCVRKMHHQSLNILAESGKERKPTKSFETEVTDMKKMIRKSNLSLKLVIKKTPSTVRKTTCEARGAKQNALTEKINGVRKRGKPASKERSIRKLQKHDVCEAKEALVRLEVDTSFTVIVRLRHYDDKKTATIVLKKTNLVATTTFPIVRNQIEDFQPTCV